MIAKTPEDKKQKRLVAVVTLVGLSWIGFLIWLAFVNWHAAVFICVLQIALNTGKTAGRVQTLTKRSFF